MAIPVFAQRAHKWSSRDDQSADYVTAQQYGLPLTIPNLLAFHVEPFLQENNHPLGGRPLIP